MSLCRKKTALVTSNSPFRWDRNQFFELVSRLQRKIIVFLNPPPPLPPSIGAAVSPTTGDERFSGMLSYGSALSVEIVLEETTTWWLSQSTRTILQPTTMTDPLQLVDDQVRCNVPGRNAHHTVAEFLHCANSGTEEQSKPIPSLAIGERLCASS